MLTHPDKIEQGVPLTTSDANIDILHAKCRTGDLVSVQASGSELLLKATDLRNTESHVEPRTKKSHSHTLSHTHTT